MAELRIAPPRRRTAADALDVLIYLVGVGVPAAAASVRWQRELPPRLTRTLAYAGPAVAVSGRNWRGPGSRLLRTRLADARTGGPVTVRSALILSLVSALEREAVRSLIRRAVARTTALSAALQPRIDEITREHVGDPAGQQRAMTELYGEQGDNPLGACLSPLLAGVAFRLPALWPPKHQTIGERLAGVVVVVER
ncbi:MAG TPA: hypothetical protein VIK04_12150 [Solirubrobacteraceae bacterium]